MRDDNGCTIRHRADHSSRVRRIVIRCKVDAKVNAKFNRKMARAVRLFVSSSPDLVAEREALGQAVAGLPVSIGWEIKHTPRRGEDVLAALEFAERCDLYLIVLGADFAAPMGAEWLRSQETAKPILAYRKRVLHSPSAQAFWRQAGVTWTEFETLQELKDHVMRTLAQALLDRGEEFGLLLEDVEGLLALVQSKTQAPVESDGRLGAGRGGVILGRGTETDLERV